MLGQQNRLKSRKKRTLFSFADNWIFLSNFTLHVSLAAFCQSSVTPCTSFLRMFVASHIFTFISELCAFFSHPFLFVPSFDVMFRHGSRGKHGKLLSQEKEAENPERKSYVIRRRTWQDSLKSQTCSHTLTILSKQPFLRTSWLNWFSWFQWKDIAASVLEIATSVLIRSNIYWVTGIVSIRENP